VRNLVLILLEMDTTHFPHRQSKQFTLCEHRLCYLGEANTPEIPADAVDPSGNLLQESWQWLGESWQITKGMARGLLRTFGASPTVEDKGEIFQSLQFFDSAPVALQRILEGEYERGLTRDQVRSISDISLWITALKNESLFGDTQPKSRPLENAYNPSSLLLSLSPEERRAIWLGFTDKYITSNLHGASPELKEKWSQLLQVQEGNDINERFKTISTTAATEGNLSVSAFQSVNNTLSGMFGLQTLTKNTDEFTLADTALRNYYDIDGKPDETNHNLLGDYDEVIRFQRAILDSTQQATVAGLQADLDRSYKLASPFLGALKLGVINDASLDDLKSQTQDSSQERDQLKAKLVATTIRRDVEKSLVGESFNFQRTWSRMKGVDKLIGLALAAGVIYAAFKKPLMAAVLAGGYLLYKGSTGNNPINDLVNGGKRLADKVWDPIKKNWTEKRGIDLPLQAGVNPTLRANAIVDFLHGNYDVHDLETEARAFMVLSERPMTMNLLAQAYEASNGEDVSGWGLKTGPGSIIDTYLQNNYPNESAELQKFFRNPDNAKEINGAMSYLFFSRAVNDQSIRNESFVREDIAAVQPMLGKLQTEDAITELTGRAREAYNRLVIKGRSLALNEDAISPGDFIRSVVGNGEIDIAPAEL